MRAPHRNQLVWLHDAAWAQVLAHPWDAQASSLLGHWHAQQLPLVVCRQRAANEAHTLSLGLPAPLPWQRRRLGLEVATSAIQRVGDFPLLAPTLLGPQASAALQHLLHQLDAWRLQARVYGSYGWQQLSGLPCVRGDSDLDLLIAVPNRDTAAQVARLLQGLELPCRVDGELLFPTGQAVAWREYAQLADEQVARVLVKCRSAVQLVDWAHFEASPC